MGYNSKIRLFEIVSILVNILLSIYFIAVNPLPVYYYFFIAIATWLLADLISGFVHWWADTYGKLKWFVIGNTFIRSFHEHHIDPRSITRHDWIETNGNNFFIGIPFLLICFYTNDLGTVIIVMLNFWTSLTNQFHKWAHQTQNYWFVKKLQNWGIILHPKAHSVHHRRPFECSYNITNGSFNIIIDKLKLYPRFEKFLEKNFKLLNNRHLE